MGGADMSTAITQQGDTVDLVCRRYYGTTVGVTEQVLEANPGLAEHGAVLPSGLLINLPAATDKPETNTINLWD
ncbi:MAG: tail protein X [Candidatus Sedimenticola sp. (ex Thyasira tokunagai)]